MLAMSIVAPALMLAAIAPAASATQLEFIYTGSGAGTLNGVTFGTSSFVITAFADTANRQTQADVFSIDHASASIAITGLGTYNILTGTRTFVNHSGQIVGLSHAGMDGTDFCDGPYSPAFATWDMLTPIGPISSPTYFSGSPLFTTSGGTLDLNSGSTITSFRAVAPEPATLTLLALGGLAALARRRTTR
jgi:hypothetical protein